MSHSNQLTQKHNEPLVTKPTEPTKAPSVQISVPTQNNNTTALIESNQNGAAAPKVFTRKINIEATRSSPKVSISDADVDKLIDQVLEQQKDNKPEEENVSIVYKAPSLGTLRLNTGAIPTSDPNPPVSVSMTTLLPNNTPQNTTNTPTASNNVVSVAVPVVTSGPARVLGYVIFFRLILYLYTYICDKIILYIAGILFL